MTSLSQPNGIFNSSAFTRPTNGAQLKYPVLVVGGSTAAYSATLGALRADPQVVVCLVQPKQIVGGQFTSQGLPASDDGDELKTPNGESYAISRTQRDFRRRQRELQKVNGQIVSNPGGGWVSALCTTPVTAARALNEGLEPFLTARRLILIPSAEPVQVFTDTSGQRRRVTAVTFQDGQSGARFTIAAKVVIEATDLGDLLELGSIESRVGQEARSETGEQKLPDDARPRCQQTITFGIVVERSTPDNSFRFPPPPGYDVEPWLHSRDFTSIFWAKSKQGGWSQLQPRYFFESGSIFDYRRLQRGGRPDGMGDVAVLNWSSSPRDDQNSHPPCCGNDYRMGIVLGVSREERYLHIQRARDRAHAYVYFLQTAGGVRSLKPRGDLTWTSDGLTLEPYIREARRGVALTVVRHEDVAKAFFPNNARAWSYEDSVGIGQYHYLDIHGNDEPGQVNLVGDEVYALPFTIPLGALIPVNTDGLILSSKSIGTTHITNSAYRMHPVEWAIGEASGHLAAFVWREGLEVREVVSSEARKRKFQGQLTRSGVPIFWFNDVLHDDPDFEPIQLLAAVEWCEIPTTLTLTFVPKIQLVDSVVSTALVKLLNLPLVAPAIATFVDVPSTHWAYAHIETLYASKFIAGMGDRRFAPNQSITKLQLSYLVKKIDQLMLPAVYQLAFAKTPLTNELLTRRELSRVLYEVLRVKLGLIANSQRSLSATVNPESISEAYQPSS